MSAVIRWLARQYITEARLLGYRDGMAGAADAIRRIAESEDRDRERAVLLAVAEGFTDTLMEVRG